MNVHTSKQRGRNSAVDRRPLVAGPSRGTTGRVVNSALTGVAGAPLKGLEYHAVLLGLRVKHPAVARIMHQKCTRVGLHVYHFQTKELKNFLGLGFNQGPN